MSENFLKKSMAIFVCTLLTSIVLFGLMTPVQAAPALQLTPFPTPTPGPDGRIVYTVQDGDTLFRIAAVSGTSLNELYDLNSMNADSIIRPGQVLLLGVISAPEVTAEPGATLPPESQTQLTPAVLQDAGTICALLYLDANGNAFRDEEEIPLPDGEVSVTERLGAFSDKGTTTLFDDEDPVCFEDIPPGEYIITMALPTGFNRTTDLSLTIELAPGDTSFINFGAQPSSILAVTPTPADGSGSGGGGNSILVILGVTVLLAGLGVGIYAGTSNRRRFKMGDE